MADRYADDIGSLVDAPIMLDGDRQFYALDNRRAPEELQAGYVQKSNNGRMNQGVWQVRKGMAKQTNSISFLSVPLFIPFTVGAGAIIVDVATDGIYAAILFSDPNASNLEYICMATGAKAYLFTPPSTVVTINYPANETIVNTDTVDMFQAGGNVYILRGETDVSTVVTSITHVTVTATVTTTSAHGFATNQWVRVGGANQTQYNGDFQITVTGGSTFTYVMASDPGANATGTLTLNRLKVPLKWNGNQASAFTTLSHGTISGNRIYMPTSNFGLLQMNRAILEYSRNKLIVSDVLNPESLDSVNGVFSFSQGWSDYLVGTHPYQDNKTLVLNRRSIYLLNGIDGDVSAMSNQLLTAQIGCISRRSIATCGSDVLFLSDLGVYRLQPGLELKLRGNWEPLSSPIDPTIRTINFQVLGAPVSAYWNNRYYLAIPTGSNTRNNVMIIYNFINGAWESIDSFVGGFFCDALVVMNLNNVATLYAISKEGGIYAYEQNEQDDFAAANVAPSQYLINGAMRTRRLIFGTDIIKRFDRTIVNMSLNLNSAMGATAYMINPALTKALPATSVITAATVTRPLIIGKRGYGLELEFANTALRGQITNYTVGAHETGLKSIKST